MAKRRLLPSQTYLQECFTYDPITGVLTWKHRPPTHFVDYPHYATWNTRWAGKEAGGESAVPDRHRVEKIKHGKEQTKYVRRMVCIDFVRYLVSRVIFKLVHNEEPGDVDHEDVNSLNNALHNLRASTHVQNQTNKTLRDDNTSGFKGVHRVASKPTKPYLAYINIDGKRKYLGYHDTAEEAYAAYCAAATQHHKDFARLV
jgi:hypothetical protein